MEPDMKMANNLNIQPIKNDISGNQIASNGVKSSRFYAPVFSVAAAIALVGAFSAYLGYTKIYTGITKDIESRKNSIASVRQKLDEAKRINSFNPDWAVKKDVDNEIRHAEDDVRNFEPVALDRAIAPTLSNYDFSQMLKGKSAIANKVHFLASENLDNSFFRKPELLMDKTAYGKSIKAKAVHARKHLPAQIIKKAIARPNQPKDTNLPRSAIRGGN